jgi:hypothetical protein
MQESLETVAHIRIAKLEFCHDDTCYFSKDLHLKIKVEDVELSKSAAVAISYTWGEFDRRDIAIGHDAQGIAVSMNLGKEWDIQELIVSLAMVCLENGEEHGMEHAACWLDQLCIIQTTENLRSALASIPSIYRTLEVVALVPGAVCGCLRRQADAIFTANGGVRPIDDWNKNWERGMRECANSAGACSYFDRVWTRQELLYSRNIRMVRTSYNEIPCVKSEADAHNLSTFADRLFTRFLLKGYSRDIAFHSVEIENRAFLTKALDSMLDYVGGFGLVMANAIPENHPRVLQVKFLLGQKIERQGQETQREDRESRVHKFLEQLALLGQSFRRATKARDYVTSVWVDCPGYILPKNFKTMCLPSLLENAVRQLEDNHGVSVLVSGSAGLFGDSSSGSALWRPRKYLGKKRIFKADEIYSVVITGHQPLPVTTNREVPLRVLGQPRTALSQFAQEYTKAFSGRDAAYVFEALKPVISNWPSLVIAAVMYRYGKIAAMSESLLQMVDINNLYIAALMKREGIPRGLGPGGFNYEDHWDRTQELDHYQAVYQMVTLALGLDFQECQSRGLRLMVCLDHYPCIGLMKAGYGNEKASTNSKLRGQQDIGTVITISTSKSKSLTTTGIYGNVLFEGVKKEGSQIARYDFTGIWVPHGRTSSFEPTAFMEAGCHNGLLG